MKIKHNRKDKLGRHQGEWIFYYEDIKTPIWRCFYIDNLIQGVAIGFYYGSDIKQYEDFYIDNSINGFTKIYAMDGNPLREATQFEASFEGEEIIYNNHEINI